MTISLNVEIPESLHASLKKYLDSHPGKDQDSTIANGLALFLAIGNTDIARHHLHGVFSEVAA
jgi:hypothetical protein